MIHTRAVRATPFIIRAWRTTVHKSACRRSACSRLTDHGPQVNVKDLAVSKVDERRSFASIIWAAN